MLPRDDAPPRGAPRASERIGSITYRSRANGTPDWLELDELTRAAQQRNRACGLTGVLLYEDGRFYQTIEGPPEALDQVWLSIQRDRRHREIDVVTMHIGGVRMFNNWDMRWIRRGERAAHPISAGLSFLEPDAPSERVAQLALGENAHGVALELQRTHPNTSLAMLIDYVIEPAARALGDAWTRDDISGAELTLALGRLATIIRDRGGVQPASRDGRRALAVTAPGESHLLGAVAVTELLIGAGWKVDLDFPRSIAELIQLVRQTSYDLIDVSCSDALDRGAETDAPELVDLLRAASLNQDVMISFGGRSYWSDPEGSRPKGGRSRSTAAALLK